MSTYTAVYYRRVAEAAAQSAQIVVPLVLEYVRPRSVVDVGCGLGAWLAAFERAGIEDYLGIDGGSIDPADLEIPVSKFITADLEYPLILDRTFDLVVSLEVAEHLSADSAEVFVDSLTQLGDVTLFSAAIPFQRGDGHVNEQWPDYWEELFSRRGYKLMDVLRPILWSNPQVQYYYAQNMFLFARHRNPDVYSQIVGRCRDASWPLAVVHPGCYLERVHESNRELSGREGLHYVMRALGRRLKLRRGPNRDT